MNQQGITPLIAMQRVGHWQARVDMMRQGIKYSAGAWITLKKIPHIY